MKRGRELRRNKKCAVFGCNRWISVESEADPKTLQSMLGVWRIAENRVAEHIQICDYHWKHHTELGGRIGEKSTPLTDFGITKAECKACKTILYMSRTFCQQHAMPVFGDTGENAYIVPPCSSKLSCMGKQCQTKAGK